MKELEAIFKERYPMCQAFRIQPDYNVIYDAKANFAFVLSDKETYLLSRFLSHDKLDNLDQNEEERQTINHFKELCDCGIFMEGPAESISEEDRAAIKEKIEYYFLED